MTAARPADDPGRVPLSTESEASRGNETTTSAMTRNVNSVSVIGKVV